MGSHCFTLSDADLTEFLRAYTDLRETQGAVAVELAKAVTNLDTICGEVDRLRAEQAEIRKRLHEIDKTLSRYIGIGIGISSVVGAMASHLIGLIS